LFLCLHVVLIVYMINREVFKDAKTIDPEITLDIHLM